MLKHNHENLEAKTLSLSSLVPHSKVLRFLRDEELLSSERNQVHTEQYRNLDRHMLSYCLKLRSVIRGLRLIVINDFFSSILDDDLFFLRTTIIRYECVVI